MKYDLEKTWSTYFNRLQRLKTLIFIHLIQMNKKDQLTPEEYKRVIHVITYFQLGSRVNDFKTIKAKLKRQLASLENNGWYSK